MSLHGTGARSSSEETTPFPGRSFSFTVDYQNESRMPIEGVACEALAVRSIAVAAALSAMLAAGGCSQDAATSCPELRQRLSVLEAARSTGTQSFEEIEAQVDRSIERDALVADMAEADCAEG